MSDTRADLAAWVAYLRDAGVRELRLDAAGPHAPRSSPAAPRRSAPPSSSRAEGRPAAPPVEAPAPELFGIEPRRAGDDPAARLRAIRRDLGECTRCKLHAGRTQIVFGVGDPRAGLMFVGEGPGAEEDARGEPFVGRAGRKLDEMIQAIGLEREQVYIANVVKCRPPDNRTPDADEAATCSPFLFAQIEAIRPRVIVTLGAPAARVILGTKIGITKLRGNWGSFRGIPVMPTFHPAYLLRQYTVENRRKVFDDLKAARARMDAPS